MRGSYPYHLGSLYRAGVHLARTGEVGGRDWQQGVAYLEEAAKTRDLASMLALAEAKVREGDVTGSLNLLSNIMHAGAPSPST